MQYTCMQYLCQTSQIASIQICIYPSSNPRSPSLHSAQKVYLQNKGFCVAQTWFDVASLSISQRAVTWMLSLDSSVNRCSLCTFCCFQSTGAFFVRPFSVHKNRCFLFTFCCFQSIGAFFVRPFSKQEEVLSLYLSNCFSQSTRATQ